MNKSIQFLLLNDGASHKLLGINPIRGLQKLGVNADYYFRSRNTGKIFNDPDYVFFLKPNLDDFCDDGANKYLRTLGVTFALIVNDQRLPIKIEKNFDFFVSPSLDWKEEYRKRHPGKHCYLIKEEWDYFTEKIDHRQTDKLKVVTMGYSTNLAEHFIPAIDEIKKVTNDITIITDTNLPIFEEKGCKFKKFQPHYTRFFDDNYDKILIEQFKEYDVGIVTQNKLGRTSNRVKALMYAGLPVIAINSSNHADLWFDYEKETDILLYHDITGIPYYLNGLKNEDLRRDISDFNTYQLEENAGIVKSAESFLEAIRRYEEDEG